MIYMTCEKDPTYKFEILVKSNLSKHPRIFQNRFPFRIQLPIPEGKWSKMKKALEFVFALVF